MASIALFFSYLNASVAHLLTTNYFFDVYTNVVVKVRDNNDAYVTMLTDQNNRCHI